MANEIQGSNVLVTLTIKQFKNGEAQTQVRGKTTFPVLLNIFLGQIGAASKQVIDQAKEQGITDEDMKVLKQDLFNNINMGASTLLDKIFPEIVMRPDLDTDAIIEAQNKIMNSKEKMEAYSKAYQESGQKILDDKQRAEMLSKRSDDIEPVTKAKAKPKPKAKAKPKAETKSENKTETKAKTKK